MKVNKSDYTFDDLHKDGWKGSKEDVEWNFRLSGISYQTINTSARPRSSKKEKYLRFLGRSLFNDKYLCKTLSDRNR